MGGMMFRLGVSLAEWGERHRRPALIRLGLRLRDFVLRRGVIERGKIKIV